MRVIKGFLLSIATVLISANAFAQSCPMCKESMTNAGQSLSHGFYLSIISMVSLPFLLVGGIISIVVKSWWTRKYPGEKFSYAAAYRAMRR